MTEHKPTMSDRLEERKEEFRKRLRKLLDRHESESDNKTRHPGDEVGAR
jgi:hypothetical protein